MKTLKGKVVSTKMEKTVVVEVERFWFHPFYKKRIRRRTRIKADCQDNSIKVGDVVEIVEVAPLSKEKHFKVKRKTVQDKLK